MAIASPPHQPAQDESDALVREARARQRRRRLLLTAAIGGAAALGLSVYAVVSGRVPNAKQTDGGRSLVVGSSRRCVPTQLRASGPRTNGAYAGHFVEDFTLTNVAGRSCTLRGWPNMAALVRGGHRIRLEAGHWRIRNGSVTAPGHLLPVREVILRPRGAASFNVVATDRFMLSHRSCVFSRVWLVTPPGTRVPLRIVLPGGGYCATGLLVTPLVAGRIDRHPAG
jgi:Domain of unknown function (DUF4232)